MKYQRVKIKNRWYPTVSNAVRSFLLKKDNLSNTSTYQGIADLCDVTYPLVSQLANEMRKAVKISDEEVKIKKRNFDNVIDATIGLSNKKLTQGEIAHLCKVSKPCIETIVKAKNLSIAD